MGPSDRSTARRVRDLTVLNESIRALTSTLELPVVLRIVCECVKRFTKAEALSLLLYDRERDELVFSATENLCDRVMMAPRNERGIAAWVAQTGQSMLVNGVASDPRFRDASPRRGDFPVRDVLAAPVSRDGAVLGVLELVNRYGGGEFTENDRTRLQTLATDIGRNLDPTEAAHDAHALRRIFEQAADVVPSMGASLVLYDAPGGAPIADITRTVSHHLLDGVRIRCDRGIAGWVARHREAVRIDDVASDPRFDTEIRERTGFVPRCMLCVPLVCKDQLLGVLQVINKTGSGRFTDAELELVQALADHAAIAIENAALHAEVKRASITDDLTGLGNTRLLHQVLPELLARESTVSLIVLDLDFLKAVVDRHGHLIGSRTIRQVGRIIASFLGPGDVAARFGGDEFVVILPATGAAAALERAERIRRAIADCRTLDDSDVDISAVTASLGVASYPAHGRDLTSLFHAADMALYEVKRRGKNAVALGSEGKPGEPGVREGAGREGVT